MAKDKKSLHDQIEKHFFGKILHSTGSKIRNWCPNICSCVLNGVDLDLNFDNGLFKQTLARKKYSWDGICSKLQSKLKPDYHRRIDELRVNGANYWLNGIPVKSRPGWRLYKTQFNDALRSHFHTMPSDTYLVCPSTNCHELFSLNHADSYAKGGRVSRRYDHVKFIIARHAESDYGTN